jgi:hypothetical protein
MAESKVDQLRAMREARHDERQKASAPNVNATAKVAKARAALKDVSYKPVTNIQPSVTNKRKPKTASDKERVDAWREENPEQYRKMQRDIMRKRRAAKKEMTT